MSTRRDFLQHLALAATLTCGGSRIATARSTPPDILFVLADDLGWTDLGCYGSSFYETPHLDALASEGLRFTQAYAACPVCSPTRASIMTGKYPARMATTDWFGAPQPEAVPGHERMRNLPLLPAHYNEQMPLEEFTLAEAFKENGYATFFAGKWHLGGEGFFPEDQGFDINKGGNHRGSPPSYFSPYNNPQLADGPEGEHLPDRLAAETIRFIDQQKGKPYLAFLSLFSVHTPLRGRADLVEKYEKKAAALSPSGAEWGREGERDVRRIQNHAVYAAMVEAMDSALGKVIDHLKAANRYDNTIIVFTSDNGGLSTSEGHPTSNLPLRAGKGWLYEGGIRVPLIVKCPGQIRAAVLDSPVCSTDYYPTLLELAGLPPRPEQHVDGLSFAPSLRGLGSSERDTLFWHYPHYGNQGGAPGAAIREGDWKLIVHFEDRPAELYNIAADPSESHDQAREQPERVAQLRGRLEAWQASVGARFPTPNPGAGATG
ncbi:MAG: sulfatase [Candidatus Hydrogenedentes bacterium]|nr:sulfatase [Candidatus Hydrogenedentota bacterium]